MAKIECSEVTKFLNDIKYMVSGIKEIIQIGDEGFLDNIANECESIKSQIETFQVVTLSIPVRVEPKKRYDYLEFYESDYTTENGLSKSDEIKIFKATLYLHVKKYIRDKIQAGDLALVPNERLEAELEAASIEFGSNLEKQINGKFFNSAMQVFQDIANEIREQRKLNPQQKMF